jgi:hypothetical protein
MSPTRRMFLRSTLVTAAGACLAPRFSEGQVSTTTIRPRKGLLFDAEDLPRIRKTLSMPRFAAYWDSLLRADLDADRKFLADELKLNNHARDFLRARQILERSSFVFALTGDRSHLDISRRAIARMLEYKRWDYFLEGGELTIGLQRAPEATIAMCCALEWLGPALDAEMKREMERQIAEKGAPACYQTLYGLKYPERVKGWGFDPEDDYPLRFDLRRWPLILNSTNLKVIPIAGLGLAACLLYDKHPQAPRWLDLALQSARAFAEMFGPDGSYDEGVGYWGYTALHLTMFIEVVYRKLGRDYRNLINFPGTVRYGLQMSMPTTDRPKDCVNFGDAWSMGDVSVAAWTARTRKDAIAQYAANRVGEIQNHCAAIWYEPALAEQKPASDLLDVRFSNDWVVSRSGWGLADGVVALRSGGPANHEHADRNSVIFKAYGERLLHDPYHAAYSYTEPLWKLRLTESHTAVLIDGKGHQYHDGHEGTNASWAESKIIRYQKTRNSVVATSDATEAYALVNKDVGMVRRTLLFLKPDVLLLFDAVRMKTAPVPVQVRFQVDNSDGRGSVRSEEKEFLVTRPGATMKARILGSGPMTVRTGKLPVPDQSGIHPYAEAESGAAKEHWIATLCTAQGAGRTHGDLTATVRDNSVLVTGKHNGRTIEVTIGLKGDTPDVRVA